MRVVALHQENMMTIERHLKSEQLVDLIEYIDMMGYGEGVYKPPLKVKGRVTSVSPAATVSLVPPTERV